MCAPRVCWLLSLALLGCSELVDGALRGPGGGDGAPSGLVPEDGGVLPGVDFGRQRGTDGGADGAEAGAPDAGECAPAAETCDGRDEDCDGRVDEGLDGLPLARACYEGRPGSAGVGRCAEGEQQCVDGRWSACEGQALPGEESCNALDDDCDGRVDEALDARCGPVELDGVGVCRAGERACIDGVPGICDGAVAPGQEICDDSDNDCDGRIDEGAGDCACQPGEIRDCYSGPGGTAGVGRCALGQQRCGVEQRLGPCEGQTLPREERCDGVDDDCDGRVDEGLPLGEPCSVGQGGCRRDGRTVCTDDGGVACDVAPGAGAPERCNGLDDDCNGVVDDVPGGCACRDGESRPCYDGPPGTDGVGRCRAGTQICAGGAYGQCEGQRQPTAERCDGRDEDCDGRVDEALVDVGGDCTEGLGVCERWGAVVCSDGRRTCDARPGAPSAEICNGLDDDCDGAVDEHAVGEVCNGADDDCDGVIDEGVRNGCGECGPEPAEICNGEDDDCDGRIDEGVANACGGCGEVPAEICNGADDDCDGRVDEGVLNACGQCGRVPREVCDGIDNDCDGWIDEDIAVIERCDGIDNDCDGLVDEGWPHNCVIP